MTVRTKRHGATYAPPRFPCTACQMSHGGCAANYIAEHTVCCETCHHVQPTH
jgi:hypothetical protein